MRSDGLPEPHLPPFPASSMLHFPASLLATTLSFLPFLIHAGLILLEQDLCS